MIRLNETTYYKLPVYEPNDNASLIDGYNKAVIELDSAVHALQNENEILKKRIAVLERKESK